MTSRILLLAAMTCVLASGEQGEEVRLSGKVESDTRVPLVGARVVVQQTEADGLFVAYTDASGEFQIELPAPGSYRVTVEKAGFFPLHKVVQLEAGSAELVFTLVQARELVQRVEVSARPASVDMDTTAAPETVTGTDIVNIPYPTSHSFRNALRIVPGLVHDQRGGIHIDGGQENQTLYLLNGFNISDPVGGTFETRINVEAVQSIEVSSGMIPAEFGKASAGVLSVYTRSGDDRFRATATNFIPAPEYRKGLVLGNWVPRANLSGPIRRGRAWFSHSIDAEYINTVIEDLPKGQDRTSSWRLNNYLLTQWNLSPANILYVGALNSLWNAARSGLGALDPIETTVDRRARQWFVHIKDQAYLPRRVLFEWGYGANRTFGREIPQGQAIYRITPDGRQGNFFVDATRRAARDQLILNLFLPSFGAQGRHQLKTGFDINRVAYAQDVRRTGYETYRVDGTLRRRTVFVGSGEARVANYELAWYIQDHWRLRPSLLVQLGLRGDWDQLIHTWSWAPRIGLAWMPLTVKPIKFTGGFALTHDATHLRLFVRPLDQYSVTTYFRPDGTVERGPALARFSHPLDRLARPRYQNWFVALEREWIRGILWRADFTRRRGHNGFTYRNLLYAGQPSAPLTPNSGGFIVEAIYTLTNQRRDAYDAVGLTLKQTLSGGYGWLFHYCWSRARSNAVLDINLDDPIVAELNTGPMPWDTPHRVKAWGYFPTPWKNWAVAFLLEWRVGFPFSVVDDEGRVVGQVNAHRFPNFFELDLHMERHFEFRRHRWALRAGANNLTGHYNPQVVNNNIDSPRFMTFYGSTGRSINFRIRWLGRSQ